MSRMSDLDIELRAAGIDPEKVNIPEVAYRMMIHQYRTGRAMTFVETAKELYRKIIPCPSGAHLDDET